MLFGVFTLTVLLQLLNAQRVRFTRELGLLLIVIGFSSWYVSWKYVNPGDFLCATRVLYYFGAFMVGYLCAKLRIAWVMPGWACLALPIALVVLYALVRYSFPLSYSLLLFLKTFCAYVICMSLLIILGTITMKDRLRSIIQRVEQLSMGIYIFNQIAMDTILTNAILNEWFREHWVIGPFILFAIGFSLLCCLVHSFIATDIWNGLLVGRIMASFMVVMDNLCNNA